MTTEELLNEMEREAELHSEETPVCVIDPETRTITVPSEYQLLGVENDKRVERIYFQCPKIVGDNQDLSQGYQLFINYQNANGDPDAYHIEDMEVEDDNITFSWLLEENVTKYRGNIQFAFGAIKPGDEAEDPDKNRWNTTINTDCTCLVGLKCTQQVAESNPDALAQIWAAIDELKAGGSESVAPTYLYKKAIFIGDSTTQGYDNDDYSYVDIFREHQDFEEVIKIAQGGGCLGPYEVTAAGKGKSCIELIQANLEEFADADVVIIQYCLNDINALAKSKIALGTADDTSETISMWGYTQKIFKTLYEANKYLKIYFVNLTGDSALFGKITELQGGSTAAEYAYWHRYWMTLMKRIRDNYNIQIINAFDDVNINVDSIADYTILTSDGIHLNTAGYQNVYRKIKASLDTESQSLYRTQPEDLIVTAVGSSGSYTLPENSYRLIRQANELGRRIYVFLPDSKIYISLVEFGEYIFGTQFTFANNKPAIIRVGISPENQFSVSLTMISTTAVATE